MGPAISVSVRGVQSLPASDITAVATSAATQGWHTAITCVSGPSTSSQWMRYSMYASKPKLPSASATSRALCQSVTQTSCSGSSVCTVPRSSVAKCPDSGATSSTFGARCEPTAFGLLGEVQQRAERLHVGGFFAHGDVAAPDAHGVDAPTAVARA